MNYQEKFESYLEQMKSTERGANGYGQLVYALQAVFEDAQIYITGDELARAFHNQIVSQIGQTDLTTIGRGFISAFTINRNNWASHDIQLIIDGECRWRHRDSVRIHGGTLLAWQQSFDTAKQQKEDNDGKKLQRRGKRWTDWITLKAKQAAPTMRAAAEKAIAERQAEIEQEITELNVNHKKAEATEAHWLRGVYICKAFTKISEAEDEWDIIEELERRANLIRRGITGRRTNAHKMTQHVGEINPDDVVTNSVLMMRDLKALWEARPVD